MHHQNMIRQQRQQKPTNKKYSKASTPVTNKTRGYIPAKFKLLPIESDVKLNQKDDKQKISHELSSLKGKSNKVDSLLLEYVTFESMNLRPEILGAIKQGPLKEVDPLRPTEIQALTIPEVLKSEGQHILCAAETGSGKTLAYLLPIINKIKDQEMKAPSFSPISTENKTVILEDQLEKEARMQTLLKSPIRLLSRPRAIVLLPSRELVEQVLSVSKYLCHFAKFRPIAITSHKNRRFVLKTLLMPTDLVVATPAGLLDYIKKKRISLSEARYLVIDEASMKRITSHSLHKSLPNLSHNFIDLKTFNYNKYEAITQTLKVHSESTSTMIFCNEKSTAKRLEKYLYSKNFPVIGLYGDIDDRTTKLESFRSQESHSKILVCTDIASRGVDTTFVNHVILFDFPTTIVDFLHRVGRTARAGKRGKATYFVTKKDRQLAERIKRNIRDKTVLS